MLEAQLLFGAAAGMLAVAVFFSRRFWTRSVSPEVPPVSDGWLAERRRVREDLVG